MISVVVVNSVSYLDGGVVIKNRFITSMNKLQGS